MSSLPRSYPRLRRYPLEAELFDVPVPPVELAPDTFAARLYSMLEPLAQLDQEAEWSLLKLVNAIGLGYQLVEDWARDTPDGPGWSLLVDLARCPDEALPWLGQFVGVRVLPGSSPDAQRARVASTDGFRRGTLDALVGAARATLTPPGTVLFRERDHDPADTPDYAYYLTVVTYTAQTPDPTATLNAILAQKPAGIVLTYDVADGQDYESVRLGWATYADLAAAFATYWDVMVNNPI